MFYLFLRMRKLKNIELNRKTILEFKSATKTPLIIILDNIRSMNNIGSVFRTADAFLIEKIFLCGITAKPPHKEIRKTALGSTNSVEWEYYKSTKDLINNLKEKGIDVIAIEQVEGSTSLEKFKPLESKNYAFIFGNEVKGISQDVVNTADGVVEIPQFGTKHSLNIAVSCGVVLWAIFSKMNHS